MAKLKLSVENLQVEGFEAGEGDFDSLAALSLTQCYSVNAGEYCVPQPATRTCGC
ncbi:hypothetical protein [Longimicrobium sp.]|uniref:hypothetical protein n=1 Tax=Longimicrobium sp. TaxID=2029185 RepID=UPI002E315974|nr:hypothetical protein [Longimicrobium sp.]HEX6039695.1 hypothetical protein [Longimicrobium sp.]